MAVQPPPPSSPADRAFRGAGVGPSVLLPATDSACALAASCVRRPAALALATGLVVVPAETVGLVVGALAFLVVRGALEALVGAAAAGGRSAELRAGEREQPAGVAGSARRGAAAEHPGEGAVGLEAPLLQPSP